jgi:hypothetical protein
MSSIMLSKDLIKTIRRRAFIPRSQETFTDDDFLEMATEEVNIGLMDQIIEARGDYLVYSVDIPMSVGTSQYAVPSRAHGNKLRDAVIVNEDGDIVYELSQLSLDEIIDFQSNYSYQKRTYFYMLNNMLVLNDDVVKQGFFLRMYFYMRPNKLVLNERAGVIDAISDSTDIDGNAIKILSFTTLPKHFTNSIKYDITGAISPNKIVHFNLIPSAINITTKTVTFLASDVPSVAAGDYLTQAEETIVPNIPTEYHPVVAQRVAIACLEAMGDEQNKQSAERKLAQMEKAVLKIVTNRVEGAPKKIKNRFGTLQALNRNRMKW